MKVGNMPQSLSICRDPESLAILKLHDVSHDHIECLGLEPSLDDTASFQSFASVLGEVEVAETTRPMQRGADKLWARTIRLAKAVPIVAQAG